MLQTPEQRAREVIDRLLSAAGWAVQDFKAADLQAARDVALPGFELNPGYGAADYLLYVDGKACGVVEAKKQGATVTGVEAQLARVSGRGDLDELVQLYNPANRQRRQATWSADRPDRRWRAYEYDELTARDKASLDIFWLKDESLADSDNLSQPAVLAQEIVADLEAAKEQFRLIAADLNGAETSTAG